MAGVKAFKKVAGADENTAKLQDRLDEFFQPITSCALIDGILLTNVQLDTTAKNIEHKLRREIQGWIIVNKSANSDVWQPSNALSTAYITLQASSPVTVSIWVF